LRNELPSTKRTDPRKRLANRRGRKPISAREQKIQAALRAAMGQAKPAAEVTAKPQNPTMELALAKAGIATPSPPEKQSKGSRTVSSNTVAQQIQKPKKARSPAQLALKDHRKPKITAEEKAEAQRLARQKRKVKEAARQKAAARRREKLALAERREEERRKAERLIAVERFISNIEDASFGELLSNWRKHVELAAFIRVTGNNIDRLPLYEELVRTVEGEWRRRSKLPHSADEYFDWPTTDAKRGDGRFAGIYSVTEGVLGYLGYTVGERSTLTQSQRQAILNRVFQMHLPPIESPFYMKEWASPRSAARLKKMANSIASFARQAKRRQNADMREAVTSWEADLRTLHDEYYVGKFGFGWPLI
jgi:hypothetical protein